MRFVRFALWLAAAAWFCWFAYVRWTTPPAAPTSPNWLRPSGGLPIELDRLVKAVPALPALPAATAPTTMPGGLIYPGDLTYLLTGPWDTTARAEIARMAGHVAGATVKPPLDELAAWLNDRSPAELAALPRPESDPNSAFVIPGWSSPVGDAAAALLFRARQAATERADFAGAWRDLRALLLLHLAGRGTAATFMIPESVVLFELGCLAQEAALSPELARQMIATIRGELGLSVYESNMVNLPGAFDPDEMLDAWYTDDGHGDGWLVLSAMGSSLPSYTGARSSPRSGAWNLLSPLYHGRATMCERLSRWQREAAEWDEISLAAATTRSEIRWKSAEAPNVFDGMAMLFVSNYQGAPLYAYEAAAVRRATVILLALSAHRCEHGTYPDALDELAALLGDVPIDPITASPFEYERVSQGFVLRQPARDDKSLMMYGSMMRDPRFPLCEGTYQPTRDRQP